MCSTCGCGKKADTFEAPKRQRIGNRFISRRKDGTISKNVDVGRSLSADRRRKAKTTASAGQGDKGDLKRAESKFDKLSNEIAKDYEKKGKSKDEAEEIGKATAYKIGVAKYGKRGMERKARAGRAKNAESFGADGIDMNRNRDRSSIHYQLFSDPSFRQRLSFGLSNPSYGGYIGYTTNPYAGGAVGLNLGYYSYGRNVKTGEQWEQWAKGRMTPEQFRDFEQGVEDGMDSSPDDYEDFDGGLVCGCGEPATIEVDKGNVHTCAFCFGVMVGKAKVEIPIIEEAISENMGAESFGADEKKRSGMKIAPKIQMVNYEDVMTEKMKNQNMKDAEEFDAQYVIVHGEDGRRKAHKTGFEERDGFTPQFIEQTRNEQLGDYVPSDSAIDNVAFENHAETFEANDEGMGAESFGADFTTIQRPHHVARVRNDRIDDATGQWVKFPNRPKQYYEYHRQQNMKGKMYDEERGGWVEMDDKARSMFEEIGGKISDFDVVGTTQDVVGKTGFNIPTGVASIAVVFMAYMTGKKYGN